MKPSSTSLKRFAISVFSSSLLLLSAGHAQAGAITGRVTGPDGVTPLVWVDVSAYRWSSQIWDVHESRAGWEWVNGDETDVNGDFAIDGLPAGSYRIRFADAIWPEDHAPEVYDEAMDLDSGIDVYVAESETVSGIDASLPETFRIAGSVPGPDGVTPLKEIDEEARRWDVGDIDTNPSAEGSAKGDGRNDVAGLPAGASPLAIADYRDVGDPILPSPVHRFWSNRYRGHFFTISESEKNNIIATLSRDWSYEGVAYNAYVEPKTGTVPLYRFWSDRYHGHFFTISESEKDNIVATLSRDWSYEGVAYYVYPDAGAGGTPVHRFWSDRYKHHFFTISENEKDNIVANLSRDWSYEGVAFYAVPAGMALIPAGTNSGTDPNLGAYSMTVGSFYMDATEVPQALWNAVYAWAIANGYSFDNAGLSKAANHPIHTVNWYDSVKWCNARSQMEGRPAVYTVGGAVYKTGRTNDIVQAAVVGYRLPTSVEWAYAARGGLESKRFPWGDEITHDYANYASSSSYDYDTSLTRGYHPDYDDGIMPFTSPVGSFAANAYGLLDMSGNVWEWCFDWAPNSEGSNRIGRGGSWGDGADSCQVAGLDANEPDYASHGIGFRTVLPSGLPEPPETPALPAPTGVVASDGDSTNRVFVSWNAVPEASHYLVWRSESAAGTKVQLGGWQADAFYHDASAVPGQTYYYFVQTALDAVGARPSALSAPDTGWLKLSAPTGVVASDGDNTDRVAILWNAVPEASHYRVWRAESEAGTQVQLGGWLAAAFYHDASAVPGQTYWYFVQVALDATGTRPSALSAPDTGWLGLSAPTGVVASDGEYTNRVSVSWNAVPEGSHYRVWRAESAAGTKVQLGGWQAERLYSDASAAPGQTYYYFVQAALDAAGTRPSALSAYDTGSLKWAPLGMVLVPGGTNGGTDPDFGAYSLTADPFYMDSTEVTKAKWDEVYTWAITNGYSFDHAGSGKAANHPVHTVSWYDCAKWCNARSQKEARMPCYTVSGNVYKTGQSAPACNFAANGYRLPTEVEWIYAARGGLSGKRFPWGDTITHGDANYRSDSSYSYDTSPTRGYHPAYATGGTPYTSPVGAFAANGYGLYDMTGNVWEWCNDSLGSSRAFRSGSWYYDASYARCGGSYWRNPDYVSIDYGFRAVCR